MRIGVISDTHGNHRFMFQAVEALIREHGANILFHLGDNYQDAEDLRMAGHDVRMVPGLWCPEYARSSIPRKLIESFDGVSVACAHALEELTGRERKSDIVLHGHTHRPEIQTRGHSVLFNPGHLSASRSRGHPASYGLIAIEAERLCFFVYRLDGFLLLERVQPREKRG